MLASGTRWAEERLQRMHITADLSKKDGFKAIFMIRASDTVGTYPQRCQTLGEGLLKPCAHQSPYTGCTHAQTYPPTAGRQRASEIRTHGNSAKPGDKSGIFPLCQSTYVRTSVHVRPPDCACKSGYCIFITRRAGATPAQ